MYLFDDVLSALDARVGRKLFLGVKAFLAHKCVIFANHHLQFAPYFDTIIVLNKQGVCVESGTHEELMLRRGAFTNMLQDVSLSESLSLPLTHSCVNCVCLCVCARVSG